MSWRPRASESDSWRRGKAPEPGSPEPSRAAHRRSLRPPWHTYPDRRYRARFELSLDPGPPGAQTIRTNCTHQAHIYTPSAPGEADARLPGSCVAGEDSWFESLLLSVVIWDYLSTSTTPSRRTQQVSLSIPPVESHTPNLRTRSFANIYRALPALIARHSLTPSCSIAPQASLAVVSAMGGGQPVRAARLLRGSTRRSWAPSRRTANGAHGMVRLAVCRPV